jgi:asparagine synthase (glutamine-hydrolysing)
LKDWATDLLDAKVLQAGGVLNPKVVTSAWNAHQAGRGNHEHRLWAILMFQSWWEANRRHIEA